MMRLMRSLGALGVLVALLAGVPLLLLWLGAALPSGGWSGGLDALLRPDDGSVLLWLIAALGWLAWAAFAVSVLTEVVAVATRQRVRIRLPGLAAPSRLAAGLLVAALALSAAPAFQHHPLAAPAAVADIDSGAGHDTAGAPTSPPVVAQPLDPAGSRTGGVERLPAPASPAAAHEPATRTHVVRAGDDLWSLAEQYYGEGREWRRIAVANPDRLTGGPDRLTVGWRLQIPEVADPGPVGRRVRVRRGETLSQIAERELGAAERWPEIYRANRAQLGDPDQLTAGLQLVLPVEQADHDRVRTLGPPAAGTDGDRTESTAGNQRGPSSTRPAERRESPPDATPARPGTQTTEPGTGASTTPGPGPTTTAPADETAGPTIDLPDAALPLAAVGGLLAAGLVAGLGRRRRVQLQARPLGRRIPHPAASTVAVEVALGRRQRPLTLRTLDRALRVIGAHCRKQGSALPVLQLAVVGEDRITLWMAEADVQAPPPFRVEGRCWSLNAADAPYLASVPGLDEALRPWPALVTLGRDDQHRQVLADLEGLGLLQLAGQERTDGEGLLAAMAVELSFSPWAEEMTLTLVGAADRLPDALGHHNVSAVTGVELLLERLERRAEARREHQVEAGLSRYRTDPDRADAWAPEVVLVGTPLTEGQRRRLHELVCSRPPVALAAVVLGGPADTSWVLELGPGGRSGELAPVGMVLTPQRLDADDSASVLELVEATSRTDTDPAPWWAPDPDEPDPPPDNVTYLGRRFGGWAPETREGDEMTTDVAERAPTTAVDHPTLLLLGPVELLGAAGTPPPRASKQCLEYCAWLLDHPGRSAQSMAGALAVAEGTRRSNMSRLRTWLGESPDGQAYLPDAYTGRIVLHPAVSSDWERLRILTATGVNRSSTDALRAALGLVRGAPLADAAPGQWHWAEELRTDMVSCLRDVGVELTERALADQDIDLARWAAARALVAAPGDELLLAARIRTEHLAGNAADTERLSLQLAAQARRLGVDLDPQTVLLLQEVVEGRVRARLA